MDKCLELRRRMYGAWSKLVCNGRGVSADAMELRWWKWVAARCPKFIRAEYFA